MKKTLLERRTRINVDATLRQRGARSQGARTRNDYLNVNKARFSRIILFSQKEKKINFPTDVPLKLSEPKVGIDFDIWRLFTEDISYVIIVLTMLELISDSFPFPIIIFLQGHISTRPLS